MSRYQRPPAPRGLPFLGPTLSFVRDPLAFTLRAVREHGDTVFLDFPRLPTYLVAAPEDVHTVLVQRHADFKKDYFTHSLSEVIGNGLVVSEGSFWRRQRKLAQPAFHHRRVQGYADVIVRRSRQLLATIRPGEVRNLSDDMMRLTLDVVAETLFGADVSSDAETIGACVDVIMDHFRGVWGSGLRLPPFLPTPGRRKFDRAREELDRVIYRLINERRRRRGDTGDLLSMFLEAEDEEDGARMTPEQVRDEALTMLIAGHETTALAVTYAWWLLSGNQDAEARLAEEVARVLGDRAATFEDLARLTYTGWVVDEAMRLYPPAYSIGRAAQVDVELSRYVVPKGTLVNILPWVNHRDPRYFDRPESFRPERWDNDFARTLPRGAYLPFGGGPRICIGNAFARMEAVLVIASMAQQFELSRVDHRPLALAPSVTLRPKEDVRMLFRRRSKAATRVAS